MKHTITYTFQKLYFLIILLIVSVVITFFGPDPDLFFGFFSQYFRFAVAVIILGILTGFLGAKLPRRFHPDRFPFKDYAWEDSGRFYQKVFRINRWKDKLFDLSQAVDGMQTKTISKKITAETLAGLIQETCVAELTHAFLILTGLIFFLILEMHWAIIFYTIYLIANLAFIMIQRANRPRLVKTYLRAKEAKSQRPKT